MTLHPSADLAGPCIRYQDALIDFVDGGQAARGVGEALAHLERCDRCTRDLAATALVLTALRRVFDDARAAESPADAWPRLRARVSARPSRPWAPGTITGLVTGAALVTALLLPTAARLNGPAYVSDAPSPAPAGLEFLRMPLPHGDGPAAPSIAVHIDRANAVGATQDAPLEVSFVGPYPDNIRPAPLTTTALAPDPSRVLRPA